MVAIHVPHQVMHFIPVTMMAVVVGTSDGIEPWRAALVVLTTALLVSALVIEMRATSEAVKRCERAMLMASHAAASLGNTSGADTDVMRAAARWGADVLNAVAQGVPADQAVSRAVPRVVVGQNGSVYASSDAGSDVSTAELDGLQSLGEDWMHRAHRSVTNTPIEGERAEAVRHACRMGSVPEEVPYHGQMLVPRAHHSPLRR